MDLKFFKDDETEAFMDELFSKIYPEYSKEEIIDWLRSTPGNTVFRVGLENTSREEFVQNLKLKIESKWPEKSRCYKTFFSSSLTARTIRL